MTSKIHLELELPEGLVDPQLEAELVRKFKEDTAVRLFQQGKISSGYAAHLLGIPRVEFLDLLRQRGIPYVEYSAEDFREDLATLERVERQAGRQSGSQ
jgi:predicted HTH domain antitoxin